MIEKIKKAYNKQGHTEKSAMMSMFLKPLNMLLALLYTPLLLDYLGIEYYGLWVTILSVISWINYFDIGIGNGLRNVLAAELFLNSQCIRKIVSTAYIMLTIIAGIFLVFLVVCTYIINWNVLFSTSIDMKVPLLVSFTFICINFILSLSNSVLYAMQKAELVSLRNIYVQIINILGVLFLKYFTDSDLVYISILFGSSSMVVYLYNIYVISKSNFSLIPSLYMFERQYISSVCNSGIKFFIIQIMCLAIFTVDNLLISHFYGARDVASFSIVDKVFFTAYSVWAAFLIPYWSGTTTAIAEKNIEWIKKSLKKLSKLSGLFFVGYIILAIFFEPLIRIWLNKELHYQSGIIWLMCIFYVFYSILATECQFINGTGKINTQLYTYILLAFVKIPLSIFIGIDMGMGSFGIRLATTILLFIEIIILGFNLRKIIKNLDTDSLDNTF